MAGTKYSLGQRLKRVLLVLAVVSALCVPAFQASTALAATDPFGNICKFTAPDGDTPPSGSTVCQSKGDDNPLSGQNSIIVQVTNIVAVIGGFAAVIVIVVAGIRYIGSNGEAEQVGKAKRAIVLAVIGLVVIAAGRVLLSFILNRI